MGRRPIVSGTGRGGGVVSGAFEMVRRGGCFLARNHAVDREYITGWFGDPATASVDAEPDTTAMIVTHEANYHPDGGQIFMPRTTVPFVALLAPPGDDITLSDFLAFWCDGTFGIHIDAGVWHQPLFPAADALTFDDAQGAVHACVSMDFIAEFGTYLRVPLPKTLGG